MASSKPKNQCGVIATKLLIKSMISVVLCAGSAVWAQAQDVPQNSTEIWTATTQTSQDNVNPSRTTESQSKSGGRSVDKKLVEVLGPDGRYRPDSDTEKETVRVDDTTTRIVVRTYTWDVNGQRKLAQITEEETRSTASGDAQTVRTTSDSDLDGNLHVVLREVGDTKKTSPDAQETKTTVYVADGNGGSTASRETQELQKHNADQSAEVKKTTLQPDVNGNWAVNEVSEKTIKEEDKTRTTEERISRLDSEGKYSEVARTVAEEKETPAGESRNTVDTYSVDIPGVSRDGTLRLKQRVITTQKKDSDGETTAQQVEQPNPGNPSDSLQVSAKTKYIVRYSSSSTQQTTTTQAADGNGTFKVVGGETKKTAETPPAQPTITPSNNPQ